MRRRGCAGCRRWPLHSHTYVRSVVLRNAQNESHISYARININRCFEGLISMTEFWSLLRFSEPVGATNWWLRSARVKRFKQLHRSYTPLIGEFGKFVLESSSWPWRWASNLSQAMRTSGTTRPLTLSQSWWPRSTSLTLKYCSLGWIAPSPWLALVLVTSMPLSSAPQIVSGKETDIYNFGKLRFRSDKHKWNWIFIFIRDKRNRAIIDIKYNSSFYIFGVETSPHWNVIQYISPACITNE